MPFYPRQLFLLCLLFLGGCGTSQDATATSNPDLFVSQPGMAKIFLYASYHSPDDKPYFEHRFQFFLNGYEQRIDDKEFIANNMAPRGYHLHVDEFDWGGNIINSQSLTVGLQEGKIYFFAAHSADDKLTLTEIPEAIGKRDVLTRKVKCLCIKSFKQTLDEWFAL